MDQDTSSAPAPRIVAIGEAMIELSSIDLEGGHAALGVAGDTLNTAIYLARALDGTGAHVDYVTALGRDALSDGMMAFMAAEGVGTGRIVRHETRLPGIYAIEVDASGERSFRYWRAQSAARTLFEDPELLEPALGGTDVIYLSGITLAILSPSARLGLIEACAVAKDQGRMVAFDSNYRPALWPDPATARTVMEAMWRATTLALPSIDDERALYPGDADAQQVLDRITALGAREIVLKRGALGPVIGPLIGQPGAPGRALEVEAVTHVVDSTAAGDSFNAGYIAARLTGQTQEEAAHAAHALACHVLAHRGAIVPRTA